LSLEGRPLTIAMLSIHSSPIGELGRRDTGGMSVYIRELARELGERGHRVDIFTRLHDSSLQPQLQLYENVRLLHLPAGTDRVLPALALYPYLIDFYRELERFRATEGVCYDLIHSHYWLSGQVGKWLKNSRKIPHMVMFHTLGALKNITAREEQESGLRIATERKLVRDCQRVLAATEREKEHLVRFYSAEPEKVGVVPCGVNLSLFRLMDKRTARRQLGLADDESIVLFVGRLAPIKGIDRLLKAVTHLQTIKALRLLIIGGDDHDTPESQNLRRLAWQLGIQDHVTFLGRVEHEELPPYYCAADVLALPSHYETFGLVALEALASGTPVVATQVGAMEEILRQGKTGCVVANGAPQALAAGIEKFLAQGSVGPWSAHAIRDSVKDFGWSDVALKIIHEYTKLLQHDYRPGIAGSPAEAAVAAAL
jgi:D-inositol-3-phosphate glycosyltransferase